jgi:hypothetical protein
VHKGQYGTGCATCHNTRSFKEIGSLHDVGAFSLRGAHDRQPCVKCHKDNRPLQGSGNLCATCHRQDDVHANSLSPRCGECHTQWSFAPARFEHATVGCNLTGLHRTLPCADCHPGGNFGATSPTCVGCHRDDALRDDPGGAYNHAGETTCARCHNPNYFFPADIAGTHASGRESICL